MTLDPVSRSRRASSRCRGITLLEMMVVLLIVGVMMGIGVGMFLATRNDAGMRTGFQELLALARYIHAQALIRRAPACLRVDVHDPREPRIEAIVDRTFGLWHGEDTVTTGAFGFNGQMNGVVLEPGKVGYAFRFKGAGCVRVEGFRIPDAADALSVEAWVYPDSPGGKGGIVDKKGEVTLQLTNGGEVEGRIGSARVRAGDIHIPQEQWSHLRLTAEAGLLVLAVNGMEVADTTLNRLPAAGDSPLLIGEAFHGLIDEVAVRGRVVEEASVLDGSVTVTVANGAADPQRKGVTRIFLNADGRLDPRYHGGPVTVTLASGTVRYTMRIGWMGTIEDIAVVNTDAAGAPPAPPPRPGGKP
jgi:prepilin-type N-terminal cleavage/methylation domain-containing protein